MADLTPDEQAIVSILADPVLSDQVARTAARAILDVLDLPGRELEARAAERKRCAAVLEHRAATAEQRRDSVMAGHLRGAARILREAGDG